MADMAALSADGAFWSAIDHWALAVVFVGVVVEGIAEWLPKERRETALWTATTRTGWLILVLALAVEYVAQRSKDADDALIIAKLSVDLETARGETARLDANLLNEQRITASERTVLARLGSVVLPRSILPDKAKAMVEALKAVGFHPVNVAMLRERESEMYGVKFAEVLKAAGMLAGTFSLPAGSRAPSLIVVAVDDEGNRLADFLFQKFQIGQGWRAQIAQGSDAAKADPALAGVPTDRNCIVIGSNADAAYQGAPGQPGEGIDQFGRPVPAPQ